MKDGSLLLVIAAMAIAFVFSHGSLAQTTNKPAVTVITANGAAMLTWDASTIGPANVEYSQDLSGWTTIATSNLTGTFEHAFGDAKKGFYQLRWTPNAPPINTATIVQGGRLTNSVYLNGMVVSTFLIGKYEVTWDEWRQVRAWAVTNGYTDLAESSVNSDGKPPGLGSAGNHPVRDVSWYDAVKWCNARSEMEGLVPVYRLGTAVYRTGQSAPTAHGGANGYRLPTEAEWEWAAHGGLSSRNYYFSGSDDLNSVAWWWPNSSGSVVDLWWGRGTWPVGTKAANELGLHDMSGNVFEMVWDSNGSQRRIRGGGWDREYESAFYVTFRGNNVMPDTRWNALGFRVARNAP